MIKIYTDAGYNWKKELKKAQKHATIAYRIDSGSVKVEKISCPPIKGLKQYNNIFELMAIHQALQAFLEEYGPGKDVQVLSDSQVVVSWLKNKKELRHLSKYHRALQALTIGLEEFFRSVSYQHIPREENIAGKFLERRGA